MSRPIWLMFSCLVIFLGQADAAPEPAAEAPPPIYLAGFQRLCSNDPQVEGAVRQQLRRMGEEPQSLSSAGGSNDCCGLRACAEPLRGRKGYLVGGMMGRERNNDAAYVWVVDLARGRVMVEHQRCSDCGRADRIVRQVALVVERLSAADSPWVSLDSLQTCSGSNPSLSGAAADASAAARASAAVAVSDNRAVVTVRAPAGLRKAAGSVRGGLRSMLREMGYEVREVSASPALDDPRSVLRGPLAQWPLLDISIQLDPKGGSNDDPERVVIRHFHDLGARQTSLDCSLQDCSGASLVRLVRYNAGILLDQIAATTQTDAEVSKGEPPVCLPNLRLDDENTPPVQDLDILRPTASGSATLPPPSAASSPGGPPAPPASPEPVTAPSPPPSLVALPKPSSSSPARKNNIFKVLRWPVSGLAVVAIGLFAWRAAVNNTHVDGPCPLPDDIGMPGITLMDGCTQKTWPSMLATGIPAAVLTVGAVATWALSFKKASPPQPVPSITPVESPQPAEPLTPSVSIH